METEGRDLNSPGRCQLFGGPEGLSTGFLSDLNLSKPSSSSSQPVLCTSPPVMSDDVTDSSCFHWSEAVSYSEVPFVPRRRKGVPLQPCCQQPGLHWRARHPPGSHFLSDGWPHHVRGCESPALGPDQQCHVWPPDAAHLWVSGNPTLPFQPTVSSKGPSSPRNREELCWPKWMFPQHVFWRRETGGPRVLRPAWLEWRVRWQQPESGLWLEWGYSLVCG